MVYMYHSFLIHSSADGHLGPNVHHSTVYNCQDMEAVLFLKVCWCVGLSVKMFKKRNTTAHSNVYILPKGKKQEQMTS